MANVKSTLSLQDKMSSTLSYITKAMNSTLQVMKNVDKQDMGKSFEEASRNIKLAENSLKGFNNTANTVSKSSGSLIKNLLGFSLIQKTLQLVLSQMDSAINRLDTMNNFPKVMSNLGIDAQESQAAIGILSEKLKGIPTTLDSAVSAVQRFTSANNNVRYSTSMFLALNNALLAGGASTDIQATALEQLSQAYAKGKPDMMEWRSLQTAMPAQLNQIAKAMGTTSAKLGESLRSGKISMDEFMQTIIKLNEKGVEGFPSLAEQAKNATGGIKTSMANMKSAINRGIESMMRSINEGLESAGLGNISSIISGFGSSIENAIKKVGNGVRVIIKIFAPVIKMTQSIFKFISDNWSMIAPILLGIATALSVLKIAQFGYNTVLAIGTALKKADTFLLSIQVAALSMQEGATFAATAAQYGFNAALLACPLTWILLIIIAVIAAIYGMVAAVNKITGTTMSGTGIVVSTLFLAVSIIWNLFLGLLDLVLMVVNFLYNAWVDFANFFANIFNDPIGSIIHAFAGMADSVLGILQGIASAIDKIFGSNLASAVSNWRSGLTSAANTLADKMGNGKYQEKYKKVNLTSESLGLKRLDYEDTILKGYNIGSKFGKSVKDFFNPNSAEESIDKTLNAINKNNQAAMSSDKSGSKAVKTTTDDDLLSDEDIQLLLDIATRDYKLSYQQITPNVTVTFGDINETADVDSILDAVADKLQEIYDSDLEV